MDAIKSGEHFRLIGDNVNFMVKASHQRHESSKRMEHWFASAAIIQHEHFENLSDVGPQKQVLDILPSPLRLECNSARICYTNIKFVMQILQRICWLQNLCI